MRSSAIAVLRSGGPISMRRIAYATRPVSRIALPRLDCRFEFVVFVPLSPRALDVDEAPRPRAQRIGEIEPRIDR